VVGAGLGGLATALRLAHRGHRVTVLEKTDQVGGRNREVRVGDCVFDGGPTLMMMLEPFRRLFRDVGERMEDHLDVVLCDPNYRVYFADGKHLDCTSNMAYMRRAIEELAGPKDAGRYPEFIGKLARMYEDCIPAFVRKNYDSPLNLASPGAFSLAMRHRMLSNLAKEVERTFESPYLRQLFCLQTMYLGLSPYAAPYVYGVLVYMEYGEGIWYPMGGMVEICRSVAKLGQSKGVEIRLSSPVKAVDGKSVTLESGEVLTADAVICNADLPYAEKNLLPVKASKERRYSCSAYMMYMDYAGELPELLHHNIVMGADFFTNLDQIFNRHEIPDDPAFYVAISGKTDAAKNPKGRSNLYCLVPCPNLDHDFTEADAADLEAKVFAKLERHSSFRRDCVLEKRTYSPMDWAGDLNLDKGAAFGLSHDFMQSVCFRPSNKDRRHPGLYYVGASTTPGNGLPMVLIGAELVEQRLQKDGYLQN